MAVLNLKLATRGEFKFTFATMPQNSLGVIRNDPDKPEFSLYSGTVVKKSPTGIIVLKGVGEFSKSRAREDIPVACYLPELLDQIFVQLIDDPERFCVTDVERSITLTKKLSEMKEGEIGFHKDVFGREIIFDRTCESILSDTRIEILPPGTTFTIRE